MKKPKVIIYDSDGMLTHGPRFSEIYSKEHNISIEDMTPFFNGPFRDCLVGKSDLKEELVKVLDVWKWKGSAEDLLHYWFSIGAELDQEVFNSIAKLREQGLVVCLATNQEKLRTEFLVKTFEYDKAFDEVFSSSQIGYKKTSREGLKIIHDTLIEKYGDMGRDEIIYWDDDEEQNQDLKREGFNIQFYSDFESFRQKMSEYEYII